MQKTYLLIFCFASVSILIAQNVAKEFKESESARLSRTPLKAVSPREGFEYFSGYLDTDEVPRNFITMYSCHNMGEVPKVKIIGNRVNLEFPVSRIDEALSVYKRLIQAKNATNQKEMDELLRLIDQQFSPRVKP